jgi:ketosteroid isomerase-like protein
MQNDYAERDKQTVRDFLRFLQERRMDDWIGLWAEDGVNIYPYHSGLLPERLEGKKAIFEVWKGVPDLFDSMHFPIKEMWVDRESRTVIARAESHSIMRGGTGRYDNSYILVFKFDNQGKIKEYLEYFNPITTGVAYGLIKVEKVEKR